MNKEYAEKVMQVFVIPTIINFINFSIIVHLIDIIYINILPIK